MIGLLKAMGSRNKLIRQLFLYNGAKYLFRGLILGNIIGLGLGFIQNQWGLIKLNEQTYYLNKVPFFISSLVEVITVLTSPDATMEIT